MKHKFSILVIIMTLTFSIGILIQSQEATPEVTPGPSPETNIEFSGEVVVIDADTIQIAGLTVVITTADINVVIQDDVVVSIKGILQPDGTIIAIEIDSGDDDDQPEATPEITPEVTPEVTEEPNDDDDGTGIIIVIEGPVESINVNIITIYSIQIELDDDDPVLTVIQIGDVIRVEGELHDDDDDGDTTIVLIAVNITFINIEVYINDDGEIWRDPLTCLIAPPPWAEANAWIIRCTTSSPNNGGGRGGGSGRSGGSSS